MSSFDILYSMKFHENTQTGFLFIEQTRNYYCQTSKGNKNILTRVMVLVVCTMSDNLLYFHEVSFKYL